jgi:succinate dehydrogenase / fumarate reductase membrane anchor subunit
MAETRLRSPLGRALGLGSAKEGVEHWWRQRVTAIALVPLAVWFVVAVIGLAGADRAVFVAWLHHPLAAVMFVLLLIATFWHAALGLQVVIEDYVHSEALKLGTIVVMRLLCFALAALGIFAVLQLALGA